MQPIQPILTKALLNFDLFKNDFYWDRTLHIPVPTTNYIRNRLGTDMSIVCGTEVQARIIILATARTIRNYLFKRSTYTDQQIAFFLMSRELDLCYEFLELVTEGVNAGMNTGSILNLYKIGKIDTIVPSLEDGINTTLLSHRRFSNLRFIPKELLHVGY